MRMMTPPPSPSKPTSRTTPTCRGGCGTSSVTPTSRATSTAAPRPPRWAPTPSRCWRTTGTPTRRWHSSSSSPSSLLQVRAVHPQIAPGRPGPPWDGRGVSPQVPHVPRRRGATVPGRVPGGEQERGGAAAGGHAGDLPPGHSRHLGARGPPCHQRHLRPGPGRPCPTAHRGAQGGGVREGGLPRHLLAVPGVGRLAGEPLPLQPGPAAPRLLLRHLRPPLHHPLVQPQPAAGLAQPHGAGANVGFWGAGGGWGFPAPHRGDPPGPAARVPGDAAGAAGGGRAALPAPGPPHVLPQGGSAKTGLGDVRHPAGPPHHHPW